MHTVEADVAVVGGGVAGTCAALAAARQGSETVLVNDRPVLGGNASSEVRVWVNGATGGTHNKYAREGGLMEELLLRNKHHNPNGDADLWDAVLVDAVREQEGLSLYLNTLVTDVEADGDRVAAAAGHQQQTERSYRFEADVFVDATGDGVLAAQAGAEWVSGREAAAEFDERAAPETADDQTLGSSVMFYTKEEDHPVEYDPPAFARDFREDPPAVVGQRTDPQQRRCCYWWIEYGGAEDLDTVGDADEIRDELWAIVYGVWDYLKNSGEFPDEEVENLALEWVGKLPGKRESRRFRGDYVLREADLVEQREFDDAVGHGGWPIDLHPPAGIYDDQGEAADQWHVPGPYAFPYRILSTPDLSNVLLAGRHVSATHVAFGSLRVQMTLATAGQAAGTGAALAADRSCDVSAVGAAHRDALQQALLREDQWIPGVAGADPDDLAREATVRASSTQPARLDAPTTAVPLDATTGLHVSCTRLDSLSLLLSADAETTLDVEVYREGRPENYVPGERVGTETVAVPAERSWVEVPVEADPGDGRGLFFVLRENPDVTVHARERELTGVMALPRAESAGGDGVTDDVYWGRPAHHGRPPVDWVPCFRLDPEPDLYAAGNLTDGHARPYGLGHSWVSEPFATADAGAGDGGAVADEDVWVELDWDGPREVAAVQLATNTKLNLWYNVFGREDRAEPETVRDYRVEALVDGSWERLARVEGNFRRHRRHVFDPVETDRVRVTVEATNGVPWAELFELRAYGPDVDWPLTER
ncbi:MAG: FAD-dependent oxidoreductase [Halobacteriaceae archaeon]